MRTRSSNGKFARLGPVNSQSFDMTPQDKVEISSNHVAPRDTYFTAKANGTSITIPISGNGWSLMKIAIMILLLSPWLYLIFKRQNIDTVSRKVTQFFDENFNCQCEPCLFSNETVYSTTSNMKKGF